MSLYSDYLRKYLGRFDELFYSGGKSTEMPDLPVQCAEGANKAPGKLVIPDYVEATASAYHVDEFKQFLGRADIRGKRILEIGSDYHLASARLFMANGASGVVATNIGDWRSEEPLPAGVTFKVCDVADADLSAHSFDIVYGIAILEHIPDLEPVWEAIKYYLRPDGIAYLQGCPLWAGPLGHHVWYQRNNNEDLEGASVESGWERAEPTLYSFADPDCNPIPHWAHLVNKPDELASLLANNGVPEQDAKGIIRYVFNLDGVMLGSCSNFRSASEILDSMDKHFDITSKRIISEEKENEYFVKALERYSEEDLRTLGLMVWMRHKVHA